MCASTGGMAERLTAYFVLHDVTQGCLTKNGVTDIIIRTGFIHKQFHMCSISAPMFSSGSNLRLHVACLGRDWLYELLFVIRMRMCIQYIQSRGKQLCTYGNVIFSTEYAWP